LTVRRKDLDRTVLEIYREQAKEDRRELSRELVRIELAAAFSSRVEVRRREAKRGWWGLCAAWSALFWWIVADALLVGAAYTRAEAAVCLVLLAVTARGAWRAFR
jgi:hypothetical protein